MVKFKEEIFLGAYQRRISYIKEKHHAQKENHLIERKILLQQKKKIICCR
jgi:hypothetical protein